MNSRSKILILLLVIVALFSAGATVMASGVFDIADPSVPPDVDNLDSFVLVGLLTIPPPSATYVEMPVDSVSVSNDRPIALLNSGAAKFAESSSTFVPDLSQRSEYKPAEVSIRILSSVKYTSAKQEIIVTVAKPSAAALSRLMYLGERELKLANGVQAWVTETGNTEDQYPNRILFLHNDLIITVAGTSALSIEQLASVALNVEVTE